LTDLRPDLTPSRLDYPVPDRIKTFIAARMGWFPRELSDAIGFSSRAHVHALRRVAFVQLDS
jgi:hypothetical protein